MDVGLGPCGERDARFVGGFAPQRHVDSFREQSSRNEIPGEGQLLSSAEIKDLHRDQNIRALRRAVGEAKAARPEILKVFLFGSLAQEEGKPGAGGELIVIVRKNFPDLFSRSPYQIFTHAVPTHSLVYSESEFEELQKDPSSFLAQNLATAVEL